MCPDIGTLAQVRATVIPVQRRNSLSIRNRREGRGRPECHPPHPHPQAPTAGPDARRHQPVPAQNGNKERSN